MNRSRCTGHRVGVTQRPHRKAIFLRPVKTGLWTNLDCRSSHEASRPTAADRHSGGFNFLLRKRLCRVDVRIPGPNVPRGKGVDTHAINLGGLRAGRHASDLLRPRSLSQSGATAWCRGDFGLTRRSTSVHESRWPGAAVTCSNALSNVPQWLVFSRPKAGGSGNGSQAAVRTCRRTRR